MNDLSIKCSNCGASSFIHVNRKLIECEYCGKTQSIGNWIDEEDDWENENIQQFNEDIYSDKFIDFYSESLEGVKKELHLLTKGIQRKGLFPIVLDIYTRALNKIADILNIILSTYEISDDISGFGLAQLIFIFYNIYFIRSLTLVLISTSYEIVMGGTIVNIIILVTLFADLNIKSKRKEEIFFCLVVSIFFGICLSFL